LGPKKPKLLFLVTEDWVFCSHRLSLARAARDAGYDVVVVTRVNRHGAVIEGEGLRLYPLTLSRSSVNPLRELATLRQITAIYRAERPDLVHHVALKPIIYGSLAAGTAGVPAVVNAFTGLGYVFIARGVKGAALRAVAGGLLKLALARVRARTILQNDDDAESLVNAGIVRRRDIVIIRGSGVDLALFPPTPPPAGVPLVVLTARMLWDKGVGEFVAAARQLRSEGIQARFVLVGDADLENPAAVPEKTLAQWREAGDVEWWGHRNDVPAILASCHIVCLPSYREGLPKTLLEAAAAGRPAVTTDVPGCRDIVQHEVTGLLVPPRDEVAVAAALRRLLGDAALRERCGAAARRLVESGFTQPHVARQTLALYAELGGLGQQADPENQADQRG